MSVGHRVPGINERTGLIDTTMKTARKNKLFHVGMYDLITLTDDEYKTSEVLSKGTSLGRLPADTLVNHEVTAVLKVRKWDKFTGERTDYIEGTHYKVDDNRIIWLGTAHEPSEGEQYSVTYEHRPTFIIFTNLPTPRYQDKQDLPRRVVIRYLAGGIYGYTP